MKCPFCQSEINAGATVCAHCMARYIRRPSGCMPVVLYFCVVVPGALLFLAGAVFVVDALYEQERAAIGLLPASAVLLLGGAISATGIRLVRGLSRWVWVR